jgi:Gene product 88
MGTPLALKPSRDRKVSPLSVWRPAAKRWEPFVANAIGLPAGPPSTGGSCSGATPFCEGCYAEAIETHFTSVGRLVNHNLDVLKGHGNRVSAIAASLRLLVEAFLVEVAKAEKKTGRMVERVYRIHWDGDFYSRPYAAAWALVMAEYPMVQFWLYTRSFNVVDLFAGLTNVAVYLSVDADNVKQAHATKRKHPFVHLAFCAETWEGTEALAALFPDERRGPRCPELTGKIPMVNSEGVGACVTCKLCVWGRNNVRFAIKH